MGETPNPRVFFEIAFGKMPVGKIVMEVQLVSSGFGTVFASWRLAYFMEGFLCVCTSEAVMG